MLSLLRSAVPARETRIGANGAACAMRDLARACAARAARGTRPPARRARAPRPPGRSRTASPARSSARNRSRNSETGGNRSAMCASETAGGSAASARSASASGAGSCGASRRAGSRRERRRPEPEEPVALVGEPLREPLRGLLDPPVLLEPPRQLLGGLLGLELVELVVLLREEAARLQLEQGRDEDEELAARLQVELLPLGETLDERDDDPGDVDLRQRQLLLEDERQQQVEGPLEGVEVQLELAHASSPRRLTLAAPDAAASGSPSSGPSSAAGASPLRVRGPAADELPPDEERRRADEDDDRDPAVEPQAERSRAPGRSAGAPRRSAPKV